MSNEFVYKTLHPMVALVDNPRQVVRANVTVKMITKTYPVQNTLQRIRKSTYSICFMCNADNEDINHLMLECQMLEET